MRSLGRAGTYVVVVSILMLAGGVSFAQLMSAPANPEYAQWLHSKGRVPGTSPEGHAFGYIPPPFQVVDKGRAPFGYTPLGLMPTSYDLRDTLNKMPPVRSQGGCGGCWTFAVFGSLETCQRPADTTDFSENNLRAHHGWDYPACSGGHFWMAAAYMARWSGPVWESDDPYSPTEPPSPASPSLPARRHVQEALILPAMTSSTDLGTIQSAIMNHGAVYVNYYHDGVYYNAVTRAFYNPSATTTPNHAVCAVGWDDTYASTNFQAGSQPPGDGAWLVRNSWGPGWGDGGYFWVSYHDAKFGKSSVAQFRASESPSNYQYNYGYDPLGNVSALNTAYAANVFTANGDEVVKAVSFYTQAPGASYTVRVYRNPSPVPAGGTPITTDTGSFTYAGYHTVPLATPVTVDAGNVFSVAVQITNGGNYPSAFEEALTGITSSATASAGQSYYSYNGSTWNDVTSYKSTANFCIRAFTDDVFSNAPPTQPTVDVTPDDAKTTDDLSVAASGSTDADGDPVSYSYRWFKDDAHQPGYNDQISIPSAAITKGELWRCEVTPNDGFDDGPVGEDQVSVSNTPPTQPTVDVTPDDAKTSDDLSVAASGSTDADGDPVSYSYRWFKDDAHQPGYNDQISVPSAATTKGELWRCEVTPNDGSDDGPVGEDQVSVSNTPPTQPTVDVTPDDAKTSDDLSVAASGSTDADGDPVSYSYRWFKDDAHQPGYNDQISVPSAAITKGELWRCEVTPNDGSDDGPVGEDQVSVSNANPTQPTVVITPANPLTIDSFRCVGSGSADVDGDAVSYSYQWYKNGVLQSGVTWRTIGASRTRVGQTWRCVVTPTDGSDDGLPGEASVTITNGIPTAPTVVISPDDPTDADGFCCSASGSTDPDGDEVQYGYQWYKNGLLQTGVTWRTIGASRTRAGQTWRCVVTPTDGRDDGPLGEASVTITSSAPTVTAPDVGGVLWHRGQAGTITWKRFAGSHVKLELWKSGSRNRVISQGTPNDGKFIWRVPSDLPWGDDYAVRVKEKQGLWRADTSDNEFTVTSPQVTCPTADGLTWYRDEVRNITWRDFTGAKVRIQLYDGDELARDIAGGTINDGEFAWHVPHDLPSGNQYRIRIAPSDYSCPPDWSDNHFRISGPRVIFPSAADLTLERSRPYAIEWGGFTGASVRIQLYVGGQLARVLSHETPNDGQFLWSVPGDLPLGSHYRIRISARDYSCPPDFSNNNFKVVAAKTAVGSTLAISSALVSRGATGMTITYTLSAAADVEVAVVNIAGRPVRRLRAGDSSPAGPGSVIWNLVSDKGTRVPPGLYLCIVRARGADGRVGSVVLPMAVAR